MFSHLPTLDLFFFLCQQNMEIHLKIKKSKRELEALENQEKEVRFSFLSVFEMVPYLGYIFVHLWTLS